MRNAQGSQKSAATPKAIKPSALPEKKRRHRIREILLGFLVLVVLVMITPAVLSLFFKDIPPVSAPDLALTKIAVPVADNAYYDLIKLEQAAVDIPQVTDNQGFINGTLAGVRWDQATVDEAVTKNAHALAYFSDAAQKSSYQFPAYADPANIDVMQFQGFPKMMPTAKVAVLNALNLQKQGKEREAFQQAMDILHVGNSIEKSRSPLLGYFVGAGIKILGLQTLQRLLADTKLSAAELTPYLAQVQSFAADPDSSAHALKMEYQFHAGYFDDNALLNNPAIRGVTDDVIQPILWRSWVPKRYYFQPHKIVAAAAAQYREVIATNTTSCDKVPKQTSDERASYNLWFYLQLYFLPNAVGQLLDANSFLPGTSVWQRQCNEKALQGATETLIALKAYAKDKGALPASLADLVPEYLPSIPQDPYDGKALKYSAEKKILYSVGSDHVDNGGSTGDDWQKMGDPTFVIQ